MIYKDSDHAMKLIQATFERVNTDEMFERIFSKKQVEVEYYIIDLDLLFTVKLDRGELDLIEDEAEEPAVIFDMDSDKFHGMCLGTLDLLAAAAARDIKMTIKDEKNSSGMAPLSSIIRRAYSSVYEEWTQGNL